MNRLFSEQDGLNLSKELEEPLSGTKPRISRFGRLTYSKEGGASENERSRSSLENKLKNLYMETSEDEESRHANAELPNLSEFSRRIGSHSPLKLTFHSQKPERLRISVLERPSKVPQESLTSRRANSPEQTPHESSMYGPSAYGKLPKIERHMSESSRIRIRPFDFESSPNSLRLSRGRVGDNSCRYEEKRGIPKSKLYSGSMIKVASSRDKISEFDKRIQHMKAELESMRKSCV